MKRLKFCVNAFHGYTHCYPCQLRYHPNITNGIGLEDLETCERVFSSSNQLASVIRYASPYRRRLLIEAYFKQWDEDKDLNLGTFILNNYVQALEILERDNLALVAAMQSMNLTHEEMDCWEKEEIVFFATLSEQNGQEDGRVLAYVELLEKLSSLEKKRARAVTQFVAFDPAASDEVKKTQRLEKERRLAIEIHERTCRDVIALETELGIAPEGRWTPAHPRYQEAMKSVKERVYSRALGNLQRLVIQRLFELHKMNLSQTSMSIHSH